MAARRLIIVLLVLLLASVAAAAIAPDRTGKLVGVETDASTTSTTETTTAVDPGVPVTPEGAVGDDLTADIAASASKPETVIGFVGDQMTLEVSSDPPRLIALNDFGMTDFAATDAPATFYLLLQEPGTYPITDGDNPSKILGKLTVEEPPTNRKEADEMAKGSGKKGDKGSQGPKGPKGPKGPSGKGDGKGN